MEIRTNPFWNPASYATVGGDVPFDGLGGAIQAAAMWSIPRRSPRSPAPSQEILDRAGLVRDMLNRLKEDVCEDNATKAARWSLRV